MSEVFCYNDYFFHVPCANLNVFPFKGKLIPSTIMTGVNKTWTCEVCGKVFCEKGEEN